MKKTLLFIFAAICTAILFSGCGTSFIAPKAPDMNKCYTMNAVITSDEREYSAAFSRVDVNYWEIVFSEPFALSGMKLVYKNGEISASLDGLETDSVSEIWAKSDVYSVLSALENASQPTGKEAVTLLDGILQVAGTDYTLVFDEKTSELTEIRCDGGSVKAAVSGFTITAEAFIPQVIFED